MEQATEIQVFNNPEFGTVRTTTIDDQPYFVGKDVAEVLGYKDTVNALKDHVDGGDKMRWRIATPSRGEQETTIINESGLYSLIFSSKLPAAKRFKHWVTAEVLPSIRKHGLYAIDEIIANPDLAIAAFQALKAEREANRALTETVAVQTQQIAEMQPKVSYYDKVLACQDLLPISKISKDYGWSAKKMNAFLHEQGIQYKQGDIWLLYQKYAEHGYTNTRTNVILDAERNPHTKIHTYWTQKGRLFIYELMKSNGILPLMERG